MEIVTNLLLEVLLVGVKDLPLAGVGGESLPGRRLCGSASFL